MYHGDAPLGSASDPEIDGAAVKSPIVLLLILKVLASSFGVNRKRAVRGVPRTLGQRPTFSDQNACIWHHNFEI